VQSVKKTRVHTTVWTVFTWYHIRKCTNLFAECIERGPNWWNISCMLHIQSCCSFVPSLRPQCSQNASNLPGFSVKYLLKCQLHLSIIQSNLAECLPHKWITRLNGYHLSGLTYGTTHSSESAAAEQPAVMVLLLIGNLACNWPICITITMSKYGNVGGVQSINRSLVCTHVKMHSSGPVQTASAEQSKPAEYSVCLCKW